MKRCAKFGYAAPLRFRVIDEKPQVGAKMPPTRTKIKQASHDLPYANNKMLLEKSRWDIDNCLIVILQCSF